MKLPAPQAAPSDLVAYVDALEDECYRDPNRAAWQRNKQRWMDLYTGNHFADPLVSSGIAAQALEPEQLSSQARHSGLCKLVYNRVMNAVLAMLAGQISNPPKVVFGARENGEPPIYYLNGFIQNPALQPIAMAAGAQDDRVKQLANAYGGWPLSQKVTLEDGTEASVQYPQQNAHREVAAAAIQVGQSIPLTPDLVQAVQALIDQGKVMSAQARMAGLPAPIGIVPPEALVEITDQSTAQFTQTIFDGLWEQCGGIEATAENILNKKVLGWQPTLFESDRTKISQGESPITLTNVEGAQVFFDPMTSSFRPPRYVIMKEPVSYEEAIGKYPELDISGNLKEKFRSGTLNYRARDGTQTSRLFYIQYARDMAVVRTLWIMDWPYPMDPDEAVACGALQIGQVPDEQQPNGSIPPADIQPATDAQGDTQATGNGDGTGGAGDAGIPGSAPDATGLAQPAIPTRQAFIHSDTGEEVTPPQPGQPLHPQWPIIYAVREIRDIEGEIVFDQRCRLGAIPIVNNINIPIPFSPYGYGEPERLDGLQMAINRVLSVMVDHHHYNAYPIEVVREEVANGRSKELRTARARPNTTIIASAEMASLVQNDLTKLLQYVDIPPMSGDAWKLLEFLVDAIDKEANNTDVQQGAAPQGSSGAWVANLQAAAAQVAQVTSQATEAWLKKIVRLFFNFISKEMTIDDVMKYTTKYPPAILQAFQRRQKMLYHDISVEIQSGSAAAKQGQTQTMVAAKQAGLPVSDPTILSALNLDPDSELKQQGEWLQKMRDSGVADQMAEQGAKTGASTNNQSEGQQAGQPAQQTPPG